MSTHPIVRSVVVVGGGVTGLLTARRLAQQGLQVTLVEASRRLGGQVCTIDLAGRRVDVGAEALHLGSTVVRGLLEELALSESIVHSRPGTTWLWTGRGLRPLPPGVGPTGPTRLGPVVTSGVMSVRGIGRAGLEPLAARMRSGLGVDEDISVGDFVSRRFGAEVAERFLDPLLGGLHAGDVHGLSLRACAPGLVGAATERRSIALRRRPRSRPGVPVAMFASWPGGLATLTDRLIADVPVRVVLGSTVRALSQTAPGYLVRLDGADEIRADAVVLAVPAAAAAPLISRHAIEASRLLEQAQVARVASVVLGFDRAATSPLRAFAANGILVPSSTGLLLKAVTNVSRKWPQFADDDLSLLRLSAGRAGSERLAQLDDTELVEQLRRDLTELTGLRADPRLVHVHRWDEGLPQLRVGHQARLAALRESLSQAMPGVVLAGSAYEGLGLGSCLGSAEAAAAAVVASLQPTHQIQTHRRIP